MQDNEPENLGDLPAATSAEYITALSHFYRAEMARANTWRQRLDVTTNWAIITTAAFLSVGFGSERISHLVIILATVFVLFFLIIEARRYKYFDLWRWRVALLNENFFAPLFDQRTEPLNRNWRELLSQDLKHSRFKINFTEAFGRRLRRNYSWIFLVLACCWFMKVSIHPEPISRFTQIVARANIYHIVPGWIVISVGVIFNATLAIIALLTLKPRADIVTIYPAKKSKIKMANY